MNFFPEQVDWVDILWYSPFKIHIYHCFDMQGGDKVLSNLGRVK